jgi:hypothetical protein
LSVAKVRVYLDTLSYTLIEESPAISGSSLLGTFGGLLGLFAGMSLISLFESVDWLIKVIAYTCVKSCRKIIRKKQEKRKIHSKNEDQLDSQEKENKTP